MTPSDIYSLSFEQIAEKLGDPTQALFNQMYLRFPDLAFFRDEDNNTNSWEPYMVEEIFTNLMSCVDDPDTAMFTIRDMVAHHKLIGLPVEVFRGLYGALLDMVTPLFYGPHQHEMQVLWRGVIDRIDATIEKADGL